MVSRLAEESVGADTLFVKERPKLIAFNARLPLALAAGGLGCLVIIPALAVLDA